MLELTLYDFNWAWYTVDEITRGGQAAGKGRQNGNKGSQQADVSTGQVLGYSPLVSGKPCAGSANV